MLAEGANCMWQTQATSENRNQGLVETLLVLELKIILWACLVVKYIQSKSTIKNIYNIIYTIEYSQWICNWMQCLKFVRLTVFKVWTGAEKIFCSLIIVAWYKIFLWMEFPIFTAQATASRKLHSFQTPMNQCVLYWPSKIKYWLTNYGSIRLIWSLQDLIYCMAIDNWAIILAKLLHFLF